MAFKNEFPGLLLLGLQKRCACPDGRLPLGLRTELGLWALGGCRAGGRPGAPRATPWRSLGATGPSCPTVEGAAWGLRGLRGLRGPRRPWLPSPCCPSPGPGPALDGPVTEGEGFDCLDPCPLQGPGPSLLSPLLLLTEGDQARLRTPSLPHPVSALPACLPCSASSRAFAPPHLCRS